MMHSTTPRVLLLCQDASTLALLSQLVEARGAEPCCSESLSVPAGVWSLVCVDEALDATVADLGVGAAPILWLSPNPRGQMAARALEAGAADVLGLPLWEPETQARLARWLPGVEPQGGVALAELRQLLDAQQELILLQLPREIVSRMSAGIQRLFPGAWVEIRLTPAEQVIAENPIPEPSLAGGESWDTVTVPLVSGGALLGEVEVAAPEGRRYTPERRGLLVAYLAQAAQGLQRTRLYEALSVGKADWEQTFDTIPDSIAIIGPEHRLLRVNSALAESVGSTPRELVGTDCFRALHGRAAPCSHCPVDEVFRRAGAVSWPQEVRRNDRVYDYQAFPLFDGQGGVRAVITYGRDVTREEQLEEGLRQSEKLVTLGQIAAGIAHEINNPLTAISSYAQLLGLQAVGPKGEESARRIQNGIERIHRLVQNLMSFARPDDDAFYPLDLNDIVAKALSFSRYEVTRGDTMLEQQLQPGLPKVLGSEAQLEQLFVSLLTNARDAVGGRGTVRVATAADSDRVELTVSDDGVGLDPAEIEKLFEPFYTTKPVGKGTGLGLFIAAGIAQKHRGRLRLYSQPGRGTEARLTLPAFT